MKAVRKGLMLLILMTSLAGTDSVHAQIKKGFFLGYGSDVDQVGLGGIAEFSIYNQWSISPSLLLYFPESNANFRFSWFEFNLNANYYFLDESSVKVYGLSGLNYLHYKRRERFAPERTFTNGEIGLNLGVGANFDAGKKFMPFMEMKFVLGEPEQVAFFLGLKF